jgi:NADH dehydrogenase
VVIVGGGFGGLYAARALAVAPVSIMLIDRRNYHLFRPMLYQVVTGLLSADEIAGPLRSILSHRNVEVLLDDVVAVNAQAHRVHLREYDVPYDFLILATGIQYNYFGHNEWQQFAPGLASLEDADVIRGKVLLAFERAEKLAALGNAAPEAIQQLLTFVLVGAGTVGVEMASTLAEMSRVRPRTRGARWVCSSGRLAPARCAETGHSSRSRRVIGQVRKSKISRRKSDWKAGRHTHDLLTYY